MIKEATETFAEIGTPANPFPGLRPFEFDESHLFFGRDGQSEQLISKLGRTRFLAVVGTSGSGKSSLVRAGLLPTLLGGFMTSAGSDWRIAIMRPGSDPIGNLAEALNSGDVFGSEIEENAAIQTAIAEATLRRGNLGLVDAVRQAAMPENENLLVLVDQFEEIFRFARVSEGESYHNDAAAFVKLILEASGQREIPIYVVLTMRSDYLGDCSQFWDLPEAINESQYLIPRLTRDQLREAIIGPAAVGLGQIAPRLVNRLLNDVGDDQDQLPILQHALMRTWDKWKERHQEGEPLDIPGYEAIGTMSSALSDHADEAYAELPNERSKEIAEKIFKGLTEKGADNREVRRPIELKGLCALAEASEAEVVAVIDVFRREGRSFLMPPSGTALTGVSLIDISHESLIRNWKRLKEWVEQESRSARIYRRLAETAVLHSEGRAGLWRDPDLQIALTWREQSKPNAVWAQRYHPDFELAMSFLDQSVAARDAERIEKEKERKKGIRRTRVTAIVFACLFLLSLVALIFASRQSVRANQQAAIAKRETERASDLLEEVRRNADEAKNSAVKEEQARLAGRQAEDKTRASEEQRRIAEDLSGEATRQKGIAEQQRRIAEENGETGRHLFYVANMNLAEKAFEERDSGRVQELLDTFLPSPATNKKSDLRRFDWYYLWHNNYKENAPLSVERTNDAPVALAISPDGRTLVVSNGKNEVKLWDLITQKELATLSRHSDTVRSVAFSPDGRTLATGSEDSSVKLWDVSTQRELATLDGHKGGVSAAAFSPDGKLLATAGRDSNVKLWDVSTRKERGTLGGRTRDVSSLAFSPDGKRLATSRKDETVSLWDVRTLQELATLGPHSDAVNSVAFSPDGGTLAAGCKGNTVKLWDVNIRQELATLETHTRNLTFDDAVHSVAFSPDGKTLAAGSHDGTVELWDVSTRQGLVTLKGHSGSVDSMAFTPDGRTLATGSDSVKLWDISARYEQATLEGYLAVFSPDGRTLASITNNNDKDSVSVKLWDVIARKEVARLEAAYALSLTFSRDGRTLAAGCAEDTVRLWDVDTKNELAPLAGGGNAPVLSVAFSPDGKILATRDYEGRITLWEVGTRKKLPPIRGGTVSGLAFSPDGKTLACGNIDSSGDSVSLWEVSTGTRVTLGGIQEPVRSVAFSSDGRTLAFGSEDSTVRLWDLNTRKELATLKGHSGAVSSVAFSSDGKTLVSGSADSTIKLWDLSTYQELATLKGHKSSVLSVAFSPDGKTLATGGADDTVRLWSAATDKEVAAHRGK